MVLIRIKNILIVIILLFFTSKIFPTEFLNPNFDVLLLESSETEYFWTKAIEIDVERYLTKDRADIKIHKLSLNFTALQSQLNSGRIPNFPKGYLNSKINLIISIDDKSLDFLLNYHDKYFKGIPVVFCGVNLYNNSLLQKQKLITGVIEKIDYVNFINTILHLHPKTRNVVAIIDSTNMGFVQNALLEKVIPAFKDSIHVLVYNNIKASQLGNAYRIPENSVFILLGNLLDDEDYTMSPQKTSSYIIKNFSIPTYTMWNPYFIKGVVGSCLLKNYYQAKEAVKIAKRILNGEDISKIPVLKFNEQKYILNYEALRKFGVDFSLITGNMLVVRKPQNFYEQHTISIWLGILIFITLISVIIILLINIKNRTKAEKALKISEERLNLVLNATNDGIWDWDIETNKIYFSPRWLEILGYKENEINGNLVSWENLVHPDDLSTTSKKLKAYLNGEKDIYETEYRMLTKSGDFKWILDRGKIVSSDSNGKPLRAIGTHLDITERKNFEVALLENEKKFRGLVEQSSDGISLFDEQGKVIEWNKGLENITGYNKKDILGKYQWDLQYQLLPDDQKFFTSAERFRDQIELFLKCGKAPWINKLMEIKIQTKNSLKTIQQIFFPIKTEHGFMAGSISRDISEMKNTEEALVKSEKKYRELTDLLPQIVFETDVEGNLIFANNIAFETFGVEKSSFNNNINVFSFIHPDDRNRAKINYSRSLKGERNFEEYKLLKKDKSFFLGVIHSSPIIENTTVKGLRGVIIDITERKRIEEEIKQNEKQYRTLIENQSEGLWIVDLNEQVIFSNPSADEIFGTSLTGKNLKNFTDEFNFNIVKIQTQNRIKELKNSYEIEVIRSDGKRRNILINASPYHDKSGEIVGGFGVFTDITEKIYTEEQLRILSRAVNQSPNSIMITDIKGNIEYVNPKFTQVSGYSFIESVGKKPNFLKSGFTSIDIYSKLWVTITSGKEWRGELLNKKKNNELFWELVSISPIVNDENKVSHYVAIKEDITDRKKAEELLINAKEEAEKSNQLKTTFLAQMSHEIRTPINSILSFTSLLKDELEDKVSEDLKSSFKVIENGGRRLIRTIDLILNMSQIQTGNFEINPREIDLEKDILDFVILDFLAAIKEKNLDFNLINHNVKDLIIADQYTVHQIFTNLLDNAVKYTPNGKIEIEILKNKSSEICVNVKDTGIGISEQYMPYLFSAFSQEEMGYTRRFDGNGLGLALVKKYVEVNNADIKVKSKKGFGSTFTITFKNITNK